MVENGYGAKITKTIYFVFFHIFIVLGRVLTGAVKLSQTCPCLPVEFGDIR